MIKPKVSVVVLNWNCRDILHECLKTLKQTAYPLEEIIVVDNASSDGSAEMVREHYPECVLLVNGENLGVAGGRNVSVQRALETDVGYIYTLDNDLIVETTTIGTLVGLMEERREIGCAGSIIYHLENTPSGRNILNRETRSIY